MLPLLLLSGLFQSGHGFQRLELAHRQVADRHAVCVRHVVMFNGVHVMYNGRLQQQQRSSCRFAGQKHQLENCR